MYHTAIDMEVDFIPYQEALALKELGFNEPCLAWYDGRYIASINQDYCKNSEEWLNTIHCATPTFSQAFRWIREKYGYWSYVKEAAKGTCRFYIEKFDEKFFNSDIIDTYEEAELACLRKLIEIVKSKQ